MMKPAGYKWGIHRALLQDPFLKNLLPETRFWNEKNLRSMLARHTSLILKPSGGKKGRGVIQVNRLGGDRYEVRRNTTNRTLKGMSKLVHHLQPLVQAAPTRYFIQERIPLIRIGDRSVDFRIMIQRKKKTPWTVTASLARVAKKGNVVTNVSAGGSILTVEQALRRSNLQVPSQTVIKRFHTVGLRCAPRLNRFARRRVIGLDLGVDPKGKTWIIEVNTLPDHYVFRRFNPAMYRRIRSFGYPR